jgi:hypothetical protein
MSYSIAIDGVEDSTALDSNGGYEEGDEFTDVSEVTGSDAVDAF